jgi:hypothetical protein
MCKPLDYKGKQTARFCAARWGLNDNGIQIFDQFYSDKNHSDLPAWTVVTSYNDKACGESRVLPRLVDMQAKLLCFRQLGAMTMGNFPATAVAAQDAACRAIK